jgi:hypothetical protein
MFLQIANRYRKKKEKNLKKMGKSYVMAAVITFGRHFGTALGAESVEVDMSGIDFKAFGHSLQQLLLIHCRHIEEFPASTALEVRVERGVDIVSDFTAFNVDHSDQTMGMKSLHCIIDGGQ